MNQEISHSYRVLLYYCYTQIADPEAYREQHHLFCIENNLLGRVIIASEGLNGTVSGRNEDCQKYIAYLHADERFQYTDFKIEEVEGHTFSKIHVRVKSEIVYSSLTHLNPTEKTGTHLSPKEFKQLKDQEDVVILDARSNYEHELGKFKNALTLDIENFRDFPEKVKDIYPFLEGKKIITYCTGGIKCEKASAFLLEQGFENVYQLHGGIIKYGIEEGGEDFEGKCYVFDNRIAVEVNQINPTTLSRCYLCHTACDRMVNCANPHCNSHLPICQKCGSQYQGACSTACQENQDKRPYDGTGYYQKKTNGYNPYKGWKRNNTTKENN